MGNKVLAILFLYWCWYGPYLYQKVLTLVLVILFEPKGIEYFSAILFQKVKHLESKFDKMCDMSLSESVCCPCKRPLLRSMLKSWHR